MRPFGNDEPAGPCAICGIRPGVLKIADGRLCRMCVPLNTTFGKPTTDEVRSMHVRDPELIGRCEEFSETESYGDLRFDDGHRLFFKGPYPNRCIPILSYGEISGYRLIVNGEATAYDSIGGKRATVRPIPPEKMKAAMRSVDDIVLELDSSRGNVSFRPYTIWSNRIRIADTRDEAFGLAVGISKKLDSIVEDNISHGTEE